MFEPPDNHKGNVARALAYFFTAYGNQNIEADWFLSRAEKFLLLQTGLSAVLRTSRNV